MPVLCCGIGGDPRERLDAPAAWREVTTRNSGREQGIGTYRARSRRGWFATGGWSNGRVFAVRPRQHLHARAVLTEVSE